MAAHARPRTHRTRTRWFAVLAASCLVALAFAAPAASGPVSDASGFEADDGNLDVDETFDWNGFAPTTWTGTAPYRTSEKNVAGWAFTGLEDAQAVTTDTAFAGGVKQDHNCPTVNTGKAPNKDDLERIYVTSNTVGGDIFLNLAWVRIPQNTTSPSAHIGFEFNQGETACATGGLVSRTAGDMLIVYDFTGSATDAPTLTLRRWVTSGSCEVGSSSPPCWGPATNLTALGFAEGRVNTSAVGPVMDALTPPAPPATASVTETLGLNEFGEAGINLTDAGVFGTDECVAFGTAFGVSRSSGNSGTAQMKDLVGPGEINITNCGRVIIRKVTDPSPDPTDTTFTYTTTGGLDPATFGLKNGESRDYGGEVFAGIYSVTEDDPSPDFAFTNLDCTASDTSHGTTIDVSAAPTVTFDLKPLDTVDCTYTNTLQRGALKILKDSTKGGAVANAGAVFSYDGSSVTDNGAGDEDPAIGSVCVSGLLPGDYTVDETSPPPGYAGAPGSPVVVTVATGTNCTDNLPTGTAVATFVNAPLSDIQVNFRDGGSGETSATIVCDNTTGTSNTAPATGWDTSETVTGIEAPTIVTCVIDIDP
jgi:hypothetical protein